MRSLKELLELIDTDLPALPVLHEQERSVPEPLALWHDDASPHARAKRGFWTATSRRERWEPLRGHWLPFEKLRSFLEDFSFHDYTLISDERIEELNNPHSIIKEPTPVPHNWKLMDQLKQCTPQFTLRNIPRAERDADLENPLRFEEAPNLLQEITEAIEEVRETEIPRPEFNDIWTAKAMNDFKVFLEETFYLCSWEEIPGFRKNRKNVEGTSWDPQYSRSEITRSLGERSSRGTIFILGPKGQPVEVEFFRRKKRREVRIIDRNPVQDDENTPEDSGVAVIGDAPPPAQADAADSSAACVTLIGDVTPTDGASAPTDNADEASDSGVTLIDDATPSDDAATSDDGASDNADEASDSGVTLIDDDEP